jgi:hypothetical protein
MSGKISARGHAAIAEGFGHMDPADLIGTGQIGHGPGHAQDTGIAARGQAHRLGGLEQQLLARRVGRGVAVEQVAVEFGIVAPPGAFEPGGLALACGGDAGGHFVRAFGGRRQGKVGGGNRVYLDMKVDPVEQGPEMRDW